jgi:type IV pilus assembly protein PilV
VFKNNKGFTLIEILVAMFILLFGMLALLNSAAVMIENNLINVLRDEAVRIAEQRMGELKNTRFTVPFDDLDDLLTAGGWGTLDVSTGVWAANCQTIQRGFRSIQNFPYTVCERVTNLSSNTKQIDIAVGWNYKGTGAIAPTQRKYQHSISSTVSR